MPDSLPPPSWGIPPYDERDLDALLSGAVTDISVTLRPLADALTALKGPPTLAELRGEATIRAEFRAQAEFGPPGSAHPSGRAETLELPALQPGSRARHAARHRVRRRRFGALLTAAAAAAIVGTVAFTGNLPGPHLLSASSRTASSAAVRPTSPNVQDRSASSVPTASRQQGERSSPRPSPSASPNGSPNGSAVCRSFFWSFEHAANGQQWWKLPVYGQLSTEAGGSGHIFSFCRPYIKGMFPHDMPVNFPGFFGTSQSGQGSQGAVSGSQGAVSSGQGSNNDGSTAHYSGQGAG